jgi:two-component system, cell cycle response regulator DivK
VATKAMFQTLRASLYILRQIFGIKNVKTVAAKIFQFGFNPFVVTLMYNNHINHISLGVQTKVGDTKSNNKKVMIVEDNELNLRLFRDLLSAFGYATVETRDGLKALELAKVEMPDLILMDIQLPHVSGLDVTQWIKADKETRDIPIIAVTAFAMRGDEERIREGGCQSYISKPIQVQSFIQTIKQFIG